MKHNNPNRNRKTYQKPVIEEVLIDKEISLIMGSMDQPPGDPEEVNGFANEETTKPDYGDQTYKTKDPFGGSKPAY